MMRLQRKHIKTPLGAMVLAASEDGLAGLWFEDQQHLPDFVTWPEVRKHPILDQARAEIDDYFRGKCKHFVTPRAAAWGTTFQQSVWESLMAIPYGGTTTYGEIARQLNNPDAVRAVGGAVGRNPWSVMTPCHRVVGASGDLTGYAGGLERKVELLRLEGVLY
jgi:methylated-DNA-[protein]-cysteine S-methyltransferase